MVTDTCGRVVDEDDLVRLAGGGPRADSGYGFLASGAALAVAVHGGGRLMRDAVAVAQRLHGLGHGFGGVWRALHGVAAEAHLGTDKVHADRTGSGFVRHTGHHPDFLVHNYVSRLLGLHNTDGRECQAGSYGESMSKYHLIPSLVFKIT